MIKVLIVDDSLTIRKKIAELIQKDPGMVVAGEASTGKIAFEMAKRYSPDLIIMDLVMPVMDGQEATELIMGYQPIPILIHSSAANRGDNYKTMDALSSGALDFIEKTCENWGKELLFRIKRAARIKVMTHIKRTKKEMLPDRTITSKSKKTPSTSYNLIVMGASTGGPKVVLDILCKLPENFPIPIILVIHMANNFQDSLAKWLGDNSSFNVKMPQNGEFCLNSRGTLFFAPPGKHLVIINNQFQYNNAEPVNFCKPSIDVFFQSVANAPQINPIGILLTGMGCDGAFGLKQIRQSGGHTIAQDKSSSIVFGMPKKAIEMKAALDVLPTLKIADKMTELVNAG
ncbi:MAG: chemotaxis-specific protein-glutamate methyltransferase CheB [Bacteroidales bacterium]|nr:chemotaxis-specific protein-glutamate methyltransferase CheB [Bacteroidales bacterium]